MLKKGLTEGFGIEVEDRNEGESNKKRMEDLSTREHNQKQSHL
jgi:hypothetical protein